MSGRENVITRIGIQLGHIDLYSKCSMRWLIMLQWSFSSRNLKVHVEGKEGNCNCNGWEMFELEREFVVDYLKLLLFRYLF